MTNRISPPCPRWFMEASVSQSVSPRQELTDKAAVRRTYPRRAVLRTAEKTGRSEPTHQKPEGELVILRSECNLLCVHIHLSYGFHFSFHSRVCQYMAISTVKDFSQGCSNSIDWPTFLRAFTLWSCKSLQFSDESRITWTQPVLEKLTAGGRLKFNNILHSAS